jgi:hypothetical protein
MDPWTRSNMATGSPVPSSMYNDKHHGGSKTAHFLDPSYNGPGNKRPSIRTQLTGMESETTASRPPSAIGNSPADSRYEHEITPRSRESQSHHARGASDSTAEFEPAPFRTDISCMDDLADMDVDDDGNRFACLRSYGTGRWPHDDDSRWVPLETGRRRSFAGLDEYRDMDLLPMCVFS